MTVNDQQLQLQLARWRLILGARAEGLLREQKILNTNNHQANDPDASLLDETQTQVDRALEQVYSVSQNTSENADQISVTAPRAPKWNELLDQLRGVLAPEVMALVQQDVFTKAGQWELLLNPDVIEQSAPSMELVTTLLALKSLMPQPVVAKARTVVGALVAKLKKRLEHRMEQAIRGALNRRRHTVRKNSVNLDWRRTIERNLKNYIPSQKKLIAEQVYFYSREQHRKEWHVIVCLDQSGSMAESLVHGAVSAAVCTSLPAVDMRLAVFDTNLVDLTHMSSDPLEVLWAAQLGGGTDIHRAIHGVSKWITEPKKTLLILVTDLFEGGDEVALVSSLNALVSDGVKVLCLLSLGQHGTPRYDAAVASAIASVGVPSVALLPGALPDVMAEVFRGQDVGEVALKFDRQKPHNREV